MTTAGGYEGARRFESAELSAGQQLPATLCFCGEYSPRLKLAPWPSIRVSRSRQGSMADHFDRSGEGNFKQLFTAGIPWDSFSPSSRGLKKSQRRNALARAAPRPGCEDGLPST